MKKTGFFALLTVAAIALTGCAKDANPSDIGSSENGAPEEMIEMTSQELVSAMRIGWNLGNTLDVCQADRDGDGIINEHVEEGEQVDETLWGNPFATQELFSALWEDGINAVRIPVTWRDHIDAEGNINAEWLDRVQTVVDYAYDLGMFVIINIHHDGGGDPQFGAWISNSVSDYD